MTEPATPAPPTTPASAPVDISTIEAAKENIVPLHSGRSATQLASVFSSSSTRSGLGVKLDSEHAKFRAQIDAVDEYERTGAWPDRGRDGLDAADVAQLAEDPLDISHQYVRFIIANYPAGANAANKLVPVLEETTRKFLGDARYSNDPRYFRLWAQYAKNMECPEDCYRFLFAKGIAEKLAALYEEYAKVLESAGKRKQADQVYLLGINRKATPLDRLKRSHLEFQARMLVAPPLPSPPRPSDIEASSRSTVRPILSSVRPVAGGGATASGTGVGPKGNGSMFAVFKDDSTNGGGGATAGQEAEWDDFGTVKSRKRENDMEKKEWAGETMPQAAPPASTLGGGFKLEVYRDETATSIPTSHSVLDSDVFARSNRAPSEAEQLRANPFKNYAPADVDLLARDPLENLEVLAPPAPVVKRTKKTASPTSSSTGEKRRTKSSSSSASASASSSKSKTAATADSQTDPAQPRPQQIAFKLEMLKDGENGWISFEEERVKRRRDKYVVEAETWNGWEWKSAWDEEIERTQKTTYTIDVETGWPLLYDSSGAPLYDFLRPPVPPIVEATSPPRPVSSQVLSSPPPSAPCSDETSPRFPRDDPVLSPQADGPPSPRTAALDEPSSPSYAPIDPNRPPSPTINTKAANAFLDGLFAKTLDFTRINPKSGLANDDDDDDDESRDGEERSTDDESDDEDNHFGGGLEEFGGASQFSTQQATQASEVSSDAGFVPFSQTRSMMGDDSSFFGSQDPIGLAPAIGGGGVGVGGGGGPASGSSAYGQGLFAFNENDENDENLTPPAAPMQLFRDITPSENEAGGGGFRPVKKRAPLGAKSIALTTDGAQQPEPAFSVFGDSRQASQVSDPVEDVYEDQQEDYEAPLRNDSPERNDLGDGYAMGRRERGVPSRYAPFVDNMTPITERTLEITAAMNTNVLSASQRSRRSSAFGGPAPVMEDDEPSTEEEEEDEDEDDNDEDVRERAFTAGFGAGGSGRADGGATSSDDGSNSDSSSDSDEDDEVEAPVPHQQLLQGMLAPNAVPFPGASPSSLPFDESCVSRLSLGPERHSPSFDTSPDTDAPEHQSGAATGPSVANSTATNEASSLAPVDPYDREMLQAYLSRMASPVQRHTNVVDLRSHTADKLGGLQKVAKKRANSKTKDRTGTLDEAWDLELDGEVFMVREKLGEGSFGAVFRIAFAADDEAEDADASFDVDGTELFLAVKVERPANCWEFHVLDQMQARLAERALASILTPHRLYAYADESFLLLDLCDRGSLLNAVNKAQEYRIAPPGPGTTGLDELLAIFFVIELLRTLEGFHSAGFIHGDLKIDNCLLRFEDVEGGGGSWQSNYDPAGAHGWGQKGLKVIDYGRTIDTTMFRPGQQFTCDLRTDQYDCIEMQTARPWTFEPDYHGVASIAYCALFGTYMETDSVSVSVSIPASRGGTDEVEVVVERVKRVPKQAFRRYHQVDLWTKLFDVLLNPRDVRRDGSLPITNELGDVRREFEAWLAANCNKNGKSLKSLLSKLERSSLTK